MTAKPKTIETFREVANPPPGVGKCSWTKGSTGRCAVCRAYARKQHMMLAFVDEGVRIFWLCWPRTWNKKGARKGRAIIFRTLAEKGQTPLDRMRLAEKEVADLIARKRTHPQWDSKGWVGRLRVIRACLKHGFDCAPASACEVRRWLDTHGDDWLSLRSDIGFVMLNVQAMRASDRKWTPGWPPK